MPCNAGKQFKPAHSSPEPVPIGDALRAGGHIAAAARIGGKRRRSDDLDAAAFPQLPFGCPLQLVAACRGALTGLEVFSTCWANPPLSSASK